MMRPLDLNLASRPFRNNTLLWLGYTALLVGAIVFTAWNVSSFRHYRNELTHLNQQERNLDEERLDLQRRQGAAQRGIRAYSIKTLERRVSKANEVIEWKAFSWTRLFNRLAEVQPYKIKVTSIRPVFRSRDRSMDEAGDGLQSLPITMEGLARDWDGWFELQEQLVEHPSFDKVEPRNQSVEDSGEIAFDLTFVYYPDVDPDVDAAAVDAVASGGEGEVETASDTRSGASGEPTVQADGEPPAAAGEAELQEVDDAWAATVDTADDGPPAETTAPTAGPAVQEADAGKSRRDTPRRRALPPVKPDEDDEGGRR